MKKLILLALIGFLINPAFAQLNITGTATMNVAPEETIVSYSISSTHDNYEEAIGTMTSRIDALTRALSRIGFKKEEIKTANFNIRQSRKYKQGELRGHEYTASQQLEIQFDYSTKRLLEVLNSTAADDASPAVSITFGMSDAQEKEVKTQLLKLAVADAKAKAELLAQETGYKITGIREINYGSSSPQVPRQSANVGMMKTFAESDMSNFEAKDLTVSDQVYISYQIGNE
ncbi:MAG: SIMPL domain-containing protein [Reichenbachiella sp.]|uniref:SIMPL domain-containing protein n=1 Tax=Reichenbachiella sp. TaxID=2184521 RepID=UPI0032669308